MTRLIDADAFRREIDTYPPFDKETQDSSAMANLAKESLLVALNNMTTIDAEPVKHGKWVRISPAKIYECSECGQTILTGDIECYKFCHGCGARMNENG